MRRRHWHDLKLMGGARTFFASASGVAVLMRLALLFRSDESFFARPFIEDAWYSLTVARSFAEGLGISINGLHATNGIQPLIVFLYAPAFFFPEELALRICFMMNVVFEIFLAKAVFDFLLNMHRSPDSYEARTTAWFAVALLLWSYSTTVYTLNGLETGLAAACILTTFNLYKRWFIRNEATASKAAALGVLLGVTVLVRIDAAFFVVSLIGYHLLRKSARPLLSRLKTSFIIGVMSVILSSPWWAYNYFTFHHIIPTSGLSQSVVTPFVINIEALVHTLINAFFVIGYIPWRYGLTAWELGAGSAIVLALVSVILFPSVRQYVRAVVHIIRTQWSMVGISVSLIYLLGLAVYYVVAFGAPHFLSRYLFLLHVFVVAFASIAAVAFRKYTLNRKPALVMFMQFALLLTMFIVYLIPYSWYFRQDVIEENDFHEIALWISANVRSQQRVGMGQSGTAGFFNRNVINLDGKVNADVYFASQEGRYCEYIRSMKFDYLIDWRKFFDDLSPCGILRNYEYVTRVGRFEVYRMKKHEP